MIAPPRRHRRDAAPESADDLGAAGASAGASTKPATGRTDPRPWLLGGVAAAFVAQPLVASEAAQDGEGLLLVVVWLLLLIGAAFWAAVHRPPRRFMWVDGCVLVLIGWTGLSALVALASGPPYRPTINLAWEWTGFGAAYAVLRLLGPNAREARALGAVMIAVATVSASYGLYQYFVELPATRAAFESAPDQQAFLQASGLPFERGTPAWDAYLRRLYSVEPFATFALANSLAGLLAPWLTVLIGVVLAFPRTGDRSISLARIGAFLALIAIAVCLVLTKSRTGWAAAFVGAALVATVFRGKSSGFKLTRLTATGAAVGLVLIAGFVAWRGGLDWQVVTEAGKSLSYRFQYWEGAWGIIEERPLMGCGVGRFGDQYTRFKGETASEEVQDPHNLLVEVWATAGTPAALALLLIAGWLVAQAFLFGLLQESAISVPSPPDSPSPQTGERQIAIGGLLGLAVGWLARMSVYSALDFVYLALAIPVGLGVWFSLRPWVERGAPVAGWWIAALTAWGLNLTIAGGIGYPGVAGTGWLLLGLTAALAERRRKAFVFSPALGWALAGAAGALLAACHFTAYQPVNLARASAAATFGRDRSSPTELAEALEQAAQNDPWAYEWPQQRAGLALGMYLESPSPDRLGDFERWHTEYLLRRGPCSGSWQVSAEWWRRLWEKTGEVEFGRRALQAQREVVKWYPNSPIRWADLATLEDALGEREAARSSAREALRLDAITPHSDKKLDKELRERIERIASGWNG